MIRFHAIDLCVSIYTLQACFLFNYVVKLFESVYRHYWRFGRGKNWLWLSWCGGGGEAGCECGGGEVLSRGRIHPQARCSNRVSRFGLAVRRSAGKRKDLGSIPLRLSFLLKKVVVCGHCLVTLSITSF